MTYSWQKLNHQFLIRQDQLGYFCLSAFAPGTLIFKRMHCELPCKKMTLKSSPFFWCCIWLMSVVVRGMQQWMPWVGLYVVSTQAAVCGLWISYKLVKRLRITINFVLLRVFLPINFPLMCLCAAQPASSAVTFSVLVEGITDVAAVKSPVLCHNMSTPLTTAVLKVFLFTFMWWSNFLIKQNFSFHCL